VLGFEVSRLARSSHSWYQLLEICVLGRSLCLWLPVHRGTRPPGATKPEPERRLPAAADQGATAGLIVLSSIKPAD
jgi:hypothetical protein